MIERFAWFEQRRAGLAIARALDEASGSERLAGVRAVTSRSGALELYARGQVAVDEALVEERPAMDRSAGIADRVQSALAEEHPASSRPAHLRRIVSAAVLLAAFGAGLYVAAARYPAPRPAPRDEAAVTAMREAVGGLRARTQRTVTSIGSTLGTTLDSTIVSVDQAFRAETRSITSDVRWAIGQLAELFPTLEAADHSS